MYECNKVPDASSATPDGLLNVAAVACPLSPLKLLVPVPAMVEISPVETVILRTRLLISEKYTLPVESTVTEYGPYTDAAVAAPPSPLKIVEPVPANVVITNVALGLRLG